MKKRLKLLTLIAIIIIIINIYFFTFNSFAVTQNISVDINSLNSSKYPSFMEKIQELKKSHPNWNFKILYTGINWEEAIAYEYTGHEKSPKNLVPDSTSYSGDWICDLCGNTTYDSGNWKCASISAIKYMMDPRASLNQSDIFQFLELSYNEQIGYSKDTLKKMLSGTFLDNDKYIETIMNSCKQYKVNPYYIVARIIQEQGKNGSVLVKGQGYNGEYVGIYNVFNIGAAGSGKEKVILNGLKKAQNYGWTSIELALTGGIQIISSSYIAVGQNTLYFQKFDVENSDGKMYWHQYMQNILAAQTEGETLRKTFANINAIDNSYTFIIPVYENMPQNTTSRPSTKKTNSNIDADLVKVNVTTSLKLRNEPNGTKTNGYLYSGEIVTRLEKATSKLNGTYWDKVLKSDGTSGYAARCTFDGENPYKDYLISIGTEPELKEELVKTLDTKTQNNEKGDVNGDGKISSSDYVLINNHIMGTNVLNDNAQKLADYNDDGKISSSDYVLIKNYIMNR